MLVFVVASFVFRMLILSLLVLVVTNGPVASFLMVMSLVIDKYGMGIDDWQGKTQILQKDLNQYYFVHLQIETALRLKLGLHSEKPADCLSYDMAILICNIHNFVFLGHQYCHLQIVASLPSVTNILKCEDSCFLGYSIM